MVDRLRTSRSAQEIGQGSAEFANWPDDFWAAPLCARGLPAHCLPVCCEWLYARLEVQWSWFIGWCRSALTLAGVDVGGFKFAQWLCSTAEPTR